MATAKNIFKAFIPPVVFSIFRRKKFKARTPEAWTGDYSSWKEAMPYCTGYDSSLILEKCKNALLKVKNGEAVYERDSIVFNEIQYSWGLLAGLQKAALENEDRLCVLDFGGSLGSTYFQNKFFLNSLKELQWCIVEQEGFVKCGRENFENEHLKFYYTIEDCMTKHTPNVLLLSSVLQYLENPYEWIEKFIGLNIPYILIDRTAFVESEKDILTIQEVPENIYKASYPSWFFGYSMLQKFTKRYKMIARFDNGFTSPRIINQTKNVFWNGIIFKK